MGLTLNLRACYRYVYAYYRVCIAVVQCHVRLRYIHVLQCVYVLVCTHKCGTYVVCVRVITCMHVFVPRIHGSVVSSNTRRLRCCFPRSFSAGYVRCALPFGGRRRTWSGLENLVFVGVDNHLPSCTLYYCGTIPYFYA